MQTEQYRITFVEDVLGSSPKSKDVYTKFIASKAPNGNGEDEAADVQDAEELGWTTFMKDEATGGLYFMDYTMKGFFKDTVQTLMSIMEEEGKKASVPKIPAYKSWINRLAFPMPRKLFIHKPDGTVYTEPDGVLERPLKAMTMQGPRVSLAKSDLIRAGAYVDFKMTILPNDKKITQELFQQCLSHGELSGFAQFRASGGYGRFTWMKLVQENS